MYELLEETQTEQVNEQTTNDNVDCIVLLVDNFDKGDGKKSYDQYILGASMYNWVVRACPTKPALVSFNEEDDDLLAIISPMLKDKEYTLVLFSDTPLITSSGVEQMIDFCVSKNLSVCKLARGYIFKTDYIKNAQAIYAINSYDVCKNELYQVNSLDSFVKATNILQARIIKYHMKNGVNIVCPQNTYIECSVAIESGVQIESFVKLGGTTTVGANSKICANSCVVDSKIDENVIVKNNCTINSSAILDNAIIGNNCVIINKSVVGEDLIIGARTTLDNTTTNSGCKIGVGCTLINTKLANNVNLEACVKCLGTSLEDVKIGSNTSVGNNCAIYGGVYLKSDFTLPDGVMLNKRK